MSYEYNEKKAYCKCGGQVEVLIYQHGVARCETIVELGDSDDPDDYCYQSGNEISHRFDSEDVGHECAECGTRFDDMASALKDGRVILKDKE